VLTFTHAIVQKEEIESRKTKYPYPGGFKQWPLNRTMMQKIDRDYARVGPADWSDVIQVAPRRSQVRSVLIFAVRNASGVQKRRSLSAAGASRTGT
jgi:hypothetical protein